ncbi:MAG: HAD family hydrolase [Verrucomicrobiota bacterium]|jgi:predicted HAD superfamily Cof-like phosphohydrolase
MDLNDSFEKVKEFHRAFDHRCPDKPTALPEERVQKRYNWMLEELDELRKADSIHDQADAVIDLMYFALGTLVEMGVKPEPLFKIVHEANMNKLWPDGKVHYAPDGKVIKHPSWRPPEPQLMREIERQIKELNGHHFQAVPV